MEEDKKNNDMENEKLNANSNEKLNDNSNKKLQIVITEYGIFRIISIIFILYAIFVLMPFSNNENFYSTGFSPTVVAQHKHSIMSWGVLLIYAAYVGISISITKDEQEQKKKAQWLAYTAIVFLFCSGLLEFFIAFVLTPIAIICSVNMNKQDKSEHKKKGLEKEIGSRKYKYE